MDLHSANIKNPIYWPELKYIGQDESAAPKIDLIQHGGWLAELAKAKAAEVIFPENTAFLHGLGVVAAAAGYRFKYEYYGEQKAVNLFCVSSQPPSTGKSSINGFFSDPFALAFSELNKENAPKRKRLKKELEELYEQDEAGQNVALDIEQTTDELKAAAKIKFIIDDATIESSEGIAALQDGYLNFVSAEADVLNVILGEVYGKGKGKANHGLFLKMWDTEFHSSARVTREGFEGFIHGSVAVLAQDESINTILQIGQESGRGISERFLLLREQNMFGLRKSSMRHKVPQQLKDDFRAFAKAVVMAPVTVLEVSSKGKELINQLTDAIDEKMIDGKAYSSNMIRGAAGKADKQVYKIASTLHIIEDWKPGGRQRKKIDDDTVKRAIAIFNELLKTYLIAADALEISGANTELAFIAKRIGELNSKRISKLEFTRLRDEVRNRGPLKGVSGLSEKLRDEYVPELQARGYLVEHNGTIYISPKLA